MTLATDIEREINATITQQWNTRVGQQIPDSKSVLLDGGAVEIDATFLYADLAKSSQMVKELDRRIAAKVLKSFHSATARLIRSNSGKIVSFDGDRILGVFFGPTKNSDATKCALQINWAVKKIRHIFETRYDAVKNASFRISHGVGVDTGTVLTVRAGARGANDLIWIGRPPNLAAKLSDLRNGHSTHITAAVFNKLMDSSKLANNGRLMWERCTWQFLDETLELYRSNWTWAP